MPPAASCHGQHLDGAPGNETYRSAARKQVNTASRFAQYRGCLPFLEPRLASQNMRQDFDGQFSRRSIDSVDSTPRRSEISRKNNGFMEKIWAGAMTGGCDGPLYNEFFFMVVNFEFLLAHSILPGKLNVRQGKMCIAFCRNHHRHSLQR